MCKSCAVVLDNYDYLPIHDHIAYFGPPPFVSWGCFVYRFPRYTGARGVPKVEQPTYYTCVHGFHTDIICTIPNILDDYNPPRSK
jgi:hypothetical protein